MRDDEDKLPDYYDSVLYPGLYNEFHYATNDKYKNDYNGSFPIYKKYHCACRSLQEFLHWFPSASLNRFQKLGSMIAVYRLNKRSVKFARRQVLFEKSKASMVVSIPPSQYNLISAYED